MLVSWTGAAEAEAAVADGDVVDVAAVVVAAVAVVVVEPSAHYWSYDSDHFHPFLHSLLETSVDSPTSDYFETAYLYWYAAVVSWFAVRFLF